MPTKINWACGSLQAGHGLHCESQRQEADQELLTAPRTFWAQSEHGPVWPSGRLVEGDDNVETPHSQHAGDVANEAHRTLAAQQALARKKTKTRPHASAVACHPCWGASKLQSSVLLSTTRSAVPSGTTSVTQTV